MSLKLNENNQGGISLDVERKDPCLADGCITTVKAILMDDLLEVIYTVLTVSTVFTHVKYTYRNLPGKHPL